MWPCLSVWPGESGATAELGMFVAGPERIHALSSGTWGTVSLLQRACIGGFEGTGAPWAEVLLSDAPEDSLLLGGPQKGTPDIK